MIAGRRLKFGNLAIRVVHPQLEGARLRVELVEKIGRYAQSEQLYR